MRCILRVLLLFAGLLLIQAGAVVAQIQTGEKPVSRTLKTSLPDPPVVEMPRHDYQKLRQQSLSRVNRKRLEYARFMEVSIDIKQQAAVRQMGEGRLYRLAVKSEDAYSLNLLFGQYRLPPGAKLFVYNRQHDHVRGAFTHKNNKASGILPVAAVKGEQVVIEYYEPRDVAFEGELVLNQVGHDYLGIFGLKDKSLKGFGDSGSCNDDKNIICYPGWQKAGRSVVLISSSIYEGKPAGTLCTGSLINNTRSDGTAYLLTANHCISSPEQAQRSHFFFNFESPTCSSPTEGPYDQTMVGAELIATPPEIDQLDFTLLELEENIPSIYRPFFAGWNTDTTNIRQSVSIHHPEGDVKKFAIDSLAPLTTSYPDNLYDPGSHWRVREWNLGTTEPGSSGAPLFDQNQLIIGDLSGGFANCQEPVDDFFARLDRSWDDFGAPEYQLQHWLDPQDGGFDKMPGYLPYDTVPSHLKLSPAEGGLLLEWNPPYDTSVVDHYLVSRNGSNVAITENLRYLDGGVQEDVRYQYRVRARLNSGEYTKYSKPAYYRLWNILPLPFTEDFPASNLPSGWYESPLSGSDSWSVAQGGHNGNPPAANSGSYNLLFYGNEGDSSRMVTPRINMEGNRYVYLSFFRAQPASSGNTDKLTVYVRFNDSLPWHPVKNYNQPQSDWTADTIYLPAPSNEYRLAFEGVSRGGGGITLDDVRIEKDEEGFDPTFSADRDHFCTDDQVTFSLDTTDSFEQYNWDFGYGASPRYVQGYGPHTVSYSNTGSKTIQVTVDGVYHNQSNDYVKVETLPNKPTISRNKDTLFTDATGDITWYYNGNQIPRGDDSVLVITRLGEYFVGVANFCGSVFSDTLRVDNINAIDAEQSKEKGIKIYPVPAGDAFYVEIQSATNQPARLKVINTMGAVVLEKQLNLSYGVNRKVVDASSLANGFYFLLIRTQDNREYKGKLIKK
jgi:V8-like Glu-specific endopeptidase